MSGLNEDPSKGNDHIRPYEDEGRLEQQPGRSSQQSPSPQPQSRTTPTTPRPGQQLTMGGAAQEARLHRLVHSHVDWTTMSLPPDGILLSTVPQHRKDILPDYPTVDETQDTISYGGGFFPNAHNFRIENANMNYYSGTGDVKHAESERDARAAMEKLASHAMPSAMLNSKEREEAPKCNEDTRRTLRGLVVEWGGNFEELQRLLWLFGPAAVGKSAVAQTVAEELKEAGHLGAAFFFSRPNNQSNPDVVIPTLVYQLARLLPAYRVIITQRISSDPLILTESRHSQFDAFITDPFLTFLLQQPLTLLSKQLLDEITNRPLSIILDGLDECESRDAQCEFVTMISNYAKDDTKSRLRWMICSRPEPHITVAFSGASKAICRWEELKVNDAEAQEDARRILETGFFQIRKQYPDQLDHNWPDQSHIRVIADRASGHLGFVSIIIRFIGDKNYDNPSGQLDACLQFLKGSARLEDRNPLHALDLLYTHILSNIPRDLLSSTLRILGLSTFYGVVLLTDPIRAVEPTALIHANFLGLDKATFYCSLHHLHSVLSVPSSSRECTESISIYHASFSEFLTNSSRAQQFFLDEGAVHLDVAICALEWLKHCHKNLPSQEVLQELMWVPASSSRQKLLEDVCDYSFAHCWKAFPKVPKDYLPTLKEALENFDFNLDYSRWKGDLQYFADFLRWLLSSDAKSLVRIDRWRAVLGVSLEKEEIVVPWYGKNPHTFVESFLQVEDPTNYYSVHLQMLTRIPRSLCLIIEDTTFDRWYENIESIDQLQADDIIIGFMGPHDSEKTHIIGVLTRMVGSYPSRFWATRIQDHPKYRNRLVLVNVPGFTDTKRTDPEILILIKDWLEQTYKKGIKLSGIIYLHPLIDHLVTAGSFLRNLQMLGSLCGDRAASRLVLLSTAWQHIDADVGEARVAELEKGFWKGFIDKGSSIDRLASEEDMWRIVEKLADTAQHMEPLLLQEEIVDLRLNLNETEAGRTLHSYLPSLLDEQRDKISSLHTQMEKSPSSSHSIERTNTMMEYNRLQILSETTAKQAKELKVSIRKRIVLFFYSRKPHSRPILFAMYQYPSTLWQ